MVFNAAGEGPESERFIGKYELISNFLQKQILCNCNVYKCNFFTERTYRKAPQKPPSSVVVEGINPSTVKVSWRYVQPSLEEEPLRGYKVNDDSPLFIVVLICLICYRFVFGRVIKT